MDNPLILALRDAKRAGTTLETVEALQRAQTVLSSSQHVHTFVTRSVLEQLGRLGKSSDYQIIKQIIGLYTVLATIIPKTETDIQIDLANDILLLSDQYRGTQIAGDLGRKGVEVLGALLQADRVTEEQRIAINAIVNKKPKSDLVDKLMEVEEDLKAGKAFGLNRLMDLFSSTTSLREQLDLFASKFDPILRHIQAHSDADMLVKVFKFLDQVIFQVYHLVFIPDIGSSGVSISQVFMNTDAQVVAENEACFDSALAAIRVLIQGGMPKPIIKLIRRLWVLYPKRRSDLYEPICASLRALGESEEGSSESFRSAAASLLYYLRHSTEVEVEFRTLLDTIPNIDNLTKLREYECEALTTPPESEVAVQLDQLQLFSGYPVAAYIPPGERFMHVVDLSEPNCILVWGFATEYCDISYRITRMDSGEELLLKKEERVQSDTSPVTGSLLVPDPGFIKFEWDNSFSWFREKHLRYRITVLRPFRRPRTEGEPVITFTNPIEMLHRDILNEPAEDNICYESAETDVLEVGMHIKGQEVCMKCRDFTRSVPIADMIPAANSLLAETIKAMGRSPRFRKLGIVEKSPTSHKGLEDFGSVAISRDADALAFLSQKNLKTAHTLISVVADSGLRSAVMYRGKLLTSETGQPLGDLSRVPNISLRDGIAMLLNVFGPAILILAGDDVDISLAELSEAVKAKVPLAVWQHSVVRESILGKGVLLEAAIKLNFLHYHFKHTF